VKKQTKRKGIKKKTKGKKNKKGKKMEKQNMLGKPKLNSQSTQYWKNKFGKDNLKKTCEETLQQNKNHVGKTP
jgi:hypothetical protein